MGRASISSLLLWPITIVLVPILNIKGRKQKNSNNNNYYYYYYSTIFKWLMMADGDACVKISSDRDGFIVKEKIIRNRK